MFVHHSSESPGGRGNSGPNWLRVVFTPPGLAMHTCAGHWTCQNSHQTTKILVKQNDPCKYANAFYRHKQATCAVNWPKLLSTRQQRCSRSAPWEKHNESIVRWKFTATICWCCIQVLFYSAFNNVNEKIRRLTCKENSYLKLHILFNVSHTWTVS